MIFLYFSCYAPVSDKERALEPVHFLFHVPKISSKDDYEERIAWVS